MPKLRHSFAVLASTIGMLVALTSPTVASAQVAPTWGPWIAPGRPAASPLSTTAPITAVSAGQSHFVLWGIGQDGALYLRAWARGSWTAWGGLGRPAGSALSTTAPITFVTLDQRHSVLYAVGQDGRLYVRANNGGTWTRWGAVGRPGASLLSTTAAVSVTTAGPRVMNVFAVGQDGQAYGRTFSSGAWGPWLELARPVPSALSTTARLTPVTVNGHLGLFAVGQDGQLYVRQRTAGDWQPWVSRGGPAASPLSSSVVATNVDSSHLTLFGVAQDGQLYGRSWTSGTWDAWAALGRPAESALSTNARIAVIPAGPLHLDVFAIAQDGLLYGRAWSSGTWQPWAAIGRPAGSALSTSAPLAIVNVTPKRVALFAVGQDGQIYGVSSPVFR